MMKMLMILTLMFTLTMTQTDAMDIEGMQIPNPNPYAQSQSKPPQANSPKRDTEFPDVRRNFSRFDLTDRRASALCAPFLGVIAHLTKLGYRSVWHAKAPLIEFRPDTHLHPIPTGKWDNFKLWQRGETEFILEYRPSGKANSCLVAGGHLPEYQKGV